MATITGMANHFAAMVEARFSSGEAPDLSFSQKLRTPIRETIRYPCMTVTANNDSCLNSSAACEHVLACGHIIFTAGPDQPCAPNCNHVEKGPGDLDRSVRSKKVQKMKNGREISTLPFYCDACVETELEQLLPSGLTSTKAEQHRTVLRQSTAIKRGKATKYRKCYIGMKTTSVPCYPDSSLSPRYEPRADYHPWDKILPQIGDNMFEDIDLNPMAETPVAQPQEVNTVLAVSADGANLPETDTVSIVQAEQGSGSQQTETLSPPTASIEQSVGVRHQSAAPPKKTPVRAESAVRDAGRLTLNSNTNETYTPRSRRARPVIPAKNFFVPIQKYEIAASTRSTVKKSKVSGKTAPVEVPKETEGIKQTAPLLKRKRGLGLVEEEADNGVKEPARMPKRKRTHRPRLADEEADTETVKERALSPQPVRGVARVIRRPRQQLVKARN